MLDPQTITRIQTWGKSLENTIKIQRVTLDHPEDPQFESLATRLQEIVPQLSIENTPEGKKLPGFAITDNILFCALPLQKELAPFLDALSYVDGKPLLIDDDTRNILDRIDIPVSLKLYIALACPHCPQMVRSLIPMAMRCQHIKLEIIDGSLFPDQAQKDNVLSAPTLILDDEFRWTQNVDTLEIAKMITQRDPSQLSAQTLQTILEQGDAEWITNQMMEKATIFKGFIKLLLHETWSVRLGAMVVVEDLCEKDEKLAASLCPVLIEQFNQQDITVQGDILYALGEAGTKQTTQWIKETLASLTHQELIDAAQDAIETLEAK